MSSLQLPKPLLPMLAFMLLLVQCGCSPFALRNDSLVSDYTNPNRLKVLVWNAWPGLTFLRSRNLARFPDL